eukprot:jgi/Mesvir1/182/Mv13534-RA.1
MNGCEILEYHPKVLKDYEAGLDNQRRRYNYPSAVDQFKRQFQYMEEKTSHRGSGGMPTNQRGARSPLDRSHNVLAATRTKDMVIKEQSRSPPQARSPNSEEEEGDGNAHTSVSPNMAGVGLSDNKRM